MTGEQAGAIGDEPARAGKPAGTGRRVDPLAGVRRFGGLLVTPAVAIAGAVVALLLAASVQAPVGPFDATFAVRGSWHGETVVRLAPLGTLRMDTHDAPFAVEVRVDELRLADAERIAADPSLLGEIEAQVATDARVALRRLLERAAALVVLGSLVASVLRRRQWRPVLAGVLVASALAGGAGTAAAATWNADAVSEPRYSGLLTIAPRAIGDVQAAGQRFGEYSAQLARLVGNVSTLYRAADSLPSLDPGSNTIRVLHVSDVHLNPQAFEVMAELVKQFDVDAIADTGDLTDFGSSPETEIFSAIGRLRVPYVWVRGNHDSATTQDAVAAQPNAVVLDGEAREVAGLRFWGVGDPRFTPDKRESKGTDDERRKAEEFAPEMLRQLRRTAPGGVDLLLVHDARLAADTGDVVPLVLSGHTHKARQGRIGEAVSLVQGSTGGAGLRSLEGKEPTPLSASVLYFDATTRQLVAYDQITVAGLGQAGVTIERHLIDRPDRTAPEAEPVPASGPPAPAPVGDSAGDPTTSSTTPAPSSSSTSAAPG